MRVVFFILLLANAAALAYFLSQPQAAGGDVAPPLRPEAVRIVAAVPAATKATQCVAWRELAPAQLARARAALTELGLGERTTVIEEEEYWLHIPPLKNRAEAEQKLRELKALGVDQATVVEEEGAFRFALSLHSLATREEAEAALKRLQEKGVKSARLTERRVPRGLLATGVDEALMGRLERLAAEYGGSALKPVPCPTP